MNFGIQVLNPEIIKGNKVPNLFMRFGLQILTSFSEKDVEVYYTRIKDSHGKFQQKSV